MLKQQVNLYSFTPKASIWRQYSPFPQAGIGLLLVFILVTFFSWQDQQKLQQELHALTAQHGQMAQRLAQVKGLDNEGQLESLQTEVTALTSLLAQRQSTLSGIKAEGVANGTGFSAYMQGLARQHFDGLWLTSIRLQQGGARIGLAGYAGEPDMVPRYIRRLGHEVAFAGTEFDAFNLEKTNTNSAVAFDVHAIAEVKE